MSNHPSTVEKTERGSQLHVPVAHIRVRTAATLKDFISETCVVIGVIPGSKSSRAELTIKVLEGLKAARTKMFIVDETNIVHDSKGPAERIHIRNFIKELVDESGIPIVFVGTPSSMSFFKSDGQTHGRVEEYVEVPPFLAPTSKDTPMFKTVKRYLEFFAEDCQLALAKDFDLLGFSQRIYLASGGRMGGIKKVFVDCAKDALKSRKSTLTLGDFAASYKRRKAPFELPSSGNPFMLEASSLAGLMKKYPRPIETAS